MVTSAAFAVFSRFNQPKIRRWSVLVSKAPRLANSNEIIVEKGETLILDTAKLPYLRRLVVNGTLIFGDKTDVQLSVGEVLITGKLQIGERERPFRHNAIITLTGDRSASRMISVTGGALELHGADRGTSWTHLAKNAVIGATKITLEKAPHWLPGSIIVLASTDFDAHQAETRQVTQVMGSTVTLVAPLQHLHWGQVADSVDERGEVGLLSHNIVIQGDEDAAKTGNGGCVMVMRGSNAHIENAEFRHLGVLGQKGRYPLHFHLAGDLSGSYVKNNSLHHCYNRSLTIHGTDHLQIESNVAFDTIGHSYFFEDGIETKNVLVGNLGLLTRAAPLGAAILPSDLTPATFWITNPDNTLRGNVAAGSDFHGFWYSFPKHPTGASESAENDRQVWPRRTPLGEFSGNVAHSNEHDGLFVDNGPNPPGVTGTPTYDPKQYPVARKGPQDSPPAPASFDNFTAYKNRRRGIWLRGSYLRVRRARLADNSIGITLAASSTRLENSRIVGETANVGHPTPNETTGDGERTLPKPGEPRTPLVGFEFYDGLVSVHNVTFVNFRSNEQRKAGSFSYLRFSPFFIDQRNFVERASFENATAVYLQTKGEPGNSDMSGDGYRSAIFTDRDGSVTGTPNRSVTVLNSLLLNDSCRVRKDWNAAVCNNSYGRLFVENRETHPQEIGPVSIRKRIGNGKTYGPQFRVFGVPKDGPNVSFQSSIMVNQMYRIDTAKQASGHLRLTLRHQQPGDWIVLSLPDMPQSHYVYDHYDYKQPLLTVCSLDALNTTSRTCIFRDPVGGRQFIKLMIPKDNVPLRAASVELCATHFCR